MLQVKRGDTFAFYADMTDPAGEPLSVESDKILCQVRDTLDRLVATLTVAKTETAGRYLFTADSTSSWPAPSSLCSDIEINVGGQINSSETFPINVLKDVSHG